LQNNSHPNSNAIHPSSPTNGYFALDTAISPAPEKPALKVVYKIILPNPPPKTLAMQTFFHLE
jgi:hypothetical protein